MRLNLYARLRATVAARPGHQPSRIRIPAGPFVFTIDANEPPCIGPPDPRRRRTDTPCGTQSNRSLETSGRTRLAEMAQRSQAAVTLVGGGDADVLGPGCDVDDVVPRVLGL